MNLKRGVFKPVRSYFSKTAAIMCTFLASGLFHEWILTVMFYIHDSEKDANGLCSSCFHPHMYGKNIMFFLWNGILIFLEFTIGKRLAIFHRLAKTLPPLVITFLVLMCSMPVAHWFFGDILKSKFMHHSQLCLPTILIIDRQSS